MRIVLCTSLLASVAVADFKRLHAERATSTSFLESNWNKYQENYHPTYVLDDDPATAWVEGADGDGLGESLTIRVSPLKKARAVRLVITPGYQKSKALFAANGTPTALQLVVRDASDVTSASITLDLEPKWGQQTFTVPLVAGLASVTLTIKSVRAGTKYRDTCLSDVQLFVDSDVPYDKRVEDQKRAAMLAWKKERLSTAKYFGALPPTYPFSSRVFDNDANVTTVSKRYSSLSEPNGEGGFLKGVKDPKFVELDALVDRGALPEGFDSQTFKTLRALAKDSKGGTWLTASSNASTRLPDGLEDLFLPELVPLLRASDITLFEARKPELELNLKRDQSVPRVGALSTFKLLEGSAAKPRRVFAQHVEVFFERADTEVTSWLLIDWGDDGVLRQVSFWREEFVVSGGARMMDGATDPKQYPPETRRASLSVAMVWRFDVTEGKVSGVTRRMLISDIGDPESITGLQEDDGIRLIVTAFTPRAKQ